MTGTLHLKLDKYLYGERVYGAVPATVYRVPEIATETRSGEERHVVLPSGSAPPLSISLPAGSYVVEAVLPTGDIVSERVTVREGRTTPVDLKGGDSPHEWLSWHHFLGNVGDKGTKGRAGASRVRPAASMYAPPHHRYGSIAGPGSWTVPSPQQGQLPSEFGSAVSLQASPHDLRVTVFQGEPRRIQGIQGLAENSPSGTLAAHRFFVLVRRSMRADLVCLPVPWQDTRRRTEANVDVLVQHSAPLDSHAIAVAVRDTMFGSALGYMTMGNITAAERLVDQAEGFLFGKILNPLAAAGGGYVLLATERDSDTKHWHNWIRNLMDWFPWLPDGAIQHAWLTFRHRRTRADLTTARDGFVDAYHRGLPYYSVGLQWLIEGLTYFAPGEPMISGMVDSVRRMSWRVNPQQPFTTIRLDSA